MLFAIVPKYNFVVTNFYLIITKFYLATKQNMYERLR